VDEREVADVHEVVDHPGGGGVPDLDPGVDAAERRVVLVRDDGDVAGGLVEAEPHEAVPLLDTDAGEMGGGRHRGAGPDDGTSTQRPPAPKRHPW
jgi:hypothetical protein